MAAYRKVALATEVSGVLPASNMGSIALGTYRGKVADAAAMVALAAAVPTDTCYRDDVDSVYFLHTSPYSVEANWGVWAQSGAAVNTTLSPTAPITGANVQAAMDSVASLILAGASIPYVKVSEVQSSGTAGGTATSGSYAVRTLNTEDSDSSGVCSLASNQVTLSAGTYIMRASAPARIVNQHKIKLYNATGAADLLIGQTSDAAAADTTVTHATVCGKFTVAASQALEIRHRVTTTRATDGLGVACTFGDSEVYTVAEFWKVA